MDFVRWAYYLFMIHSGIADTYRYEQFLPKCDLFYDFTMLFVSCNPNSGNKKKVIENYLIAYSMFLVYLLDKIHN